MDFEDYRLINLKDYSIIEKVIYELFEEKDGKIFLFFDEVQNLANWEK